MDNSGKGKYLLMLVVVGLACALVGFLVGKSGLAGKNSSPGITPAATLNDLFTFQNATINGQVTKVDGKVLTVKNNKGVTGTVETADQVMVMIFSDNGSMASPSSDLKKVPLNKDLMINLNMTDNKMKVTTISSAPPMLAPVPPAANVKPGTQPIPPPALIPPPVSTPSGNVKAPPPAKL